MLTFSFISRRVLAATIAASALAVAVIPAASASALTSASGEKICKYADTPVSQLSAAVAVRVVHCLTNKARLENGLPKVKWVETLHNSAQTHAERSIALRWWNPNDGASSHVDPQTGTHPDDRIAAAGYCTAGHRDSNENTFTSSGVWQYPATPKGAVSWWLSDPPHRATIMNPLYKAEGVAVVRGLAVPGTVYNNPGTFVSDFGACNGNVS